jgi:hypothetical protein
MGYPRLLILNGWVLGCFAAAVPVCRVELPVYNEFGKPLAAKIVSVSHEGKPGVNILEFKPLVIEAKGTTLFVSPHLRKHEVMVETVVAGSKHSLRKRVPFMSCPMRMSQQTGRHDVSGVGDSSVETLVGRFTGCRMEGDWWVRLAPMFGSQERGLQHEGTIDRRTGRFEVISSFTGERHTLVLGRGLEPVGVFGVNLKIGAKNDAGDLPLARCP